MPLLLKAKQRAEEAESLTDEDKQGKTPQQILDMEKRHWLVKRRILALLNHRASQSATSNH